MADDYPDNDQSRSFVPLTEGTEVGHYVISHKIGVGGMGEVYLAEDSRLRRKVALKFMPVSLASDHDMRARFTREAQASAKLDHPNIVPVHEVDEFQGRPYFAMAHIEGQTLREVIKQGKLSTSEAIDYTMQICGGLHKAHESGVVHRDIKPGNIIIDNENRPRILDFGLAMVAGEEKLTKTGSTLGTVEYMSPEQIEGKKVDHRSDLFSVGVILYEMLTGRRPFEADYETAVHYNIVHEEPEPIARFKSGVPGELQRIVTKLLEKDPTVRYQSAVGVTSDLKPLCQSVSSAVSQVSSSKRARLLASVVTISALIIIAVWGGLQIKNWLSPPATKTKSLAVIDFVNIGAEEDAYLASGLAEDLAIKLRKLDGFKVASSADIRRLAKENLLPREIATRLNVQYALGGSLLREDTLVRVNVELIDKETGDVIWSDQINKQFTEIFQFIDEVSLKIVQTLEIRLTPVEEAAMATKPTDNTGAYDHYLKGRHFYYRVTFRDNELAEKEFERALQSDPSYPLALAGLADVYVQRYRERFDYDEYWLDSSKVLIENALTLEPDLAEAYESLAEILLKEDDLEGAREAAEKARDIMPDWDEPYVHLGEIYRQLGKRNIALAMFDTALSLRASVGSLIGKGYIFENRGQMDSAKAAYQAAQQLNPYHETPYLCLGWVYESLQEWEKAESLYTRAIEVRPDHAIAHSMLASRMYSRGGVKEGEELLRAFVKQFPYGLVDKPDSQITASAIVVRCFHDER